MSKRFPLPARLNRTRLHSALLLVAASGLLAVQSNAAEPIIGKTYAKSKEGSPPPARDTKGLPNVIWILLDDAGFGATSAFGGGIDTPVFERLANDGLRYTNFHTTAISSPTRASLLTGRNHHNVGMGLFPHKFASAEFPGYTGRLQPEAGTIAEYLRERGYSTYHLGKWHLTPDAETTDLGPFERWPSGKGFDHNFGILGGASDQYTADLVEDNHHVKSDGRHLNMQLADKAIAYIDRQRQLAPDKPFFLYYSPGAVHSPHQVDQPWLDKYKGRFDAGWDVYRAQTFERQKKLGLVPANAVLPPRDPRVPAWDSLSAEQKKVYARFMEGYAAFYEQTDYEIGRVVEHLRKNGQLDNTAIFAILGDNGASKEGGPNGNLVSEFSTQANLNGVHAIGRRKDDDATQLRERLDKIDEIGTAKRYSNYPIGWAQATNTPFRSWKGDANAEGGSRNPLIVHWPKGIAAKGEVRTQYGHVIDLLPTTLEFTGSKPPATLHGIRQQPIQGTSLRYSFDDAAAPNRHTRQHYAIFGSGAIVENGWKASFPYRPDFDDIYNSYPPSTNVANNADRQVWELYDLNSDFNELHNVADKHPEKLKALKALFDAEAKANHVYPLINWSDTDAKVNAELRQQ